ncbi:MAG: hypothetical protein JRC92_02800 [Deltaproteobacteria bacterium]|nr:hypothetical protein [Deltaproteobacteria bacterium]
MIWEEHAVYFTEATLKSALDIGGLTLERFERFPQALEDSLVVIGRAGDEARPAAPADEPPQAEVASFLAYAEGLESTRRAVRERLSRAGRVAVFGAGHLSCCYINLLGLADRIEFVVDDHPRKQGLFMPGSGRPVLGSQALTERGVSLCLMGLSPDIEDKIMAANQAFLQAGGQFASLIPASPRRLEP